VVIGIIAVLASLLLPSLVSAKEMGYRTVCLNNQHQIYLVCNLYWDDNDECPFNLSDADYAAPGNGNLSGSSFPWPFFTDTYVPVCGFATGNIAAAGVVSTDSWNNGRIQRPVYDCPVKEKQGWEQKPQCGTYNYNAALSMVEGDERQDVAQGFNYPELGRMSSVVNPECTVLVRDVVCGGSTSGAYYSTVTREAYEAVHGPGRNVLLADAHAEYIAHEGVYMVRYLSERSLKMGWR